MARVVAVAIVCIAFLIFQNIYSPGSISKSALIDQADVIAIVNISQVVSLQKPGTCSLDNYKFRADVQTESVIKGNPPSLFIMYSNGRT